VLLADDFEDAVKGATYLAVIRSGTASDSDRAEAAMQLFHLVQRRDDEPVLNRSNGKPLAAVRSEDYEPPMRLLVPSVASLTLLVGATPALAHPSVAVSPRQVIPGDPVLVTVRGALDAPAGKADGKPLHFFGARGAGTYQAVFGVPLDRAPGDLEVTIEGAPEPATIQVREHTFPEASVTVEEELANPPAEDRKRIDADNAAILGALGKSADEPRFHRPFRLPVGGKMTSSFGEWRTFNDGHRSQHLGIDQAEREGAPVRAINDGVVVLVRSCFLAGNVVVIDHGAGIGSAYFHLSEASAAEGDKVLRGDVIGRVGSTGRTTGPHVHVSIHLPGTFVDPPHFLRLQLRPRSPAPAAAK
jgi:murein DD-endopeptidase MepM/ murein hydrolase activator NlpD